MGTEVGASRWILGFDGGCSTCAELAQEIVAISNGRLAARSLRSSDIQRWKEQALGANAPWAPTLLAIEEDRVRAWTGPGMICRLIYLLGPRRAWSVMEAIGRIAGSSTGPADPGRRRIIWQGVRGAVAGAVLLGSSRFVSSPIAHAQDVGEESFSAEEVTIEVHAESGWKINRLSRSQFDRMRDDAKEDRKFELIGHYLERSNKWNRFHSSGWKYYKHNDMIRKGYQQQYKHRDSGALAVVQYVVEANGRIDRVGYVWRNSEVADRIFVRNGKVRTQTRGDVRGDDVSAEDVTTEGEEVTSEAAYQFPAPCILGRLSCGAAQGLAIGVAGGAAAVGCGAAGLGPFGIGVCGGAAGGAVAVATDPVKEGCIDLISGEDC